MIEGSESIFLPWIISRYLIRFDLHRPMGFCSSFLNWLVGMSNIRFKILVRRTIRSLIFLHISTCNIITLFFTKTKSSRDFVLNFTAYLTERQRDFFNTKSCDPQILRPLQLLPHSIRTHSIQAHMVSLQEVKCRYQLLLDSSVITWSVSEYSEYASTCSTKRWAEWVQWIL